MACQDRVVLHSPEDEELRVIAAHGPDPGWDGLTLPQAPANWRTRKLVRSAPSRGIADYVSPDVVLSSPDCEGESPDSAAVISVQSSSDEESFQHFALSHSPEY